MKPGDGLYADGRHYDRQHEGMTEDIPFYLKQARKFGDPVLELACGTGRITIPLASDGIDITGLDAAEGMLQQAKAKAAQSNVDVRWIHGDCRRFSLGRRFKLIFIPFNSIAHLHDEESIEGCFACVKEHLSEAGRFIVDIFNPRLDILLRDPSEHYPVAEYADPDDRGRVTVTENNIYDAASQVNRIKWYYRLGDSEDQTVEELNMRVFYPQELDALLRYNGFIIDAKYGDFDESPFTSKSPKQIVVSHVAS